MLDRSLLRLVRQEAVTGLRRHRGLLHLPRRQAIVAPRQDRGLLHILPLEAITVVPLDQADTAALRQGSSRLHRLPVRHRRTTPILLAARLDSLRISTSCSTRRPWVVLAIPHTPIRLRMAIPIPIHLRMAVRIRHTTIRQTHPCLLDPDLDMQPRQTRLGIPSYQDPTKRRATRSTHPG